jgi:hypothetical protein
MNFINDIKYVDFPITLGGIIQINENDFYDIIEDNMEFGNSYRFTILNKGNPLTKDDVPFNSIFHFFPDTTYYKKELQDWIKFQLELPYKSRNYIIKLYTDTDGKSIVSGNLEDIIMKDDTYKFFMSMGGKFNSLNLLKLQTELEEIVRKSDLVKEIYANHNVRLGDIYVPTTEFKDYDLNLSLAYFKSTV